MEGDIIVSGSDGFFDNIFDQEVLAVISESPGIVEAGKSFTSATADVKCMVHSFQSL
jgi:hypothetical protein